MAMDSLLVTGSNGLLGSHFVEAVRQSDFGATVEILTPSRGELDLENPAAVITFFETHRPSIVVHLAAKVMGLRGNLDFQIASMTENLRINESVFLAAAKYPPKKMFFAGTAASYAYPYSKMPLREEQFFEGDVHSGEFGYAWAKRMAYPWLKLLAQDYGVAWTYGIFTNLFGPRDRFLGDFTHVIPALINRAGQPWLKGEAQKVLQVWGNPAITRDFLYAPEAAAAILACVRSSTNEGQLINIASGRETQMGKIAEIIANQFAINEIDWQVDKPVGVSRRYMDISALLKLGFEPKIEIENQLISTIEWYKTSGNDLR